ncbi:MAG: acylneuraminate cytidylyltransferase family protein [Pirellula sp.]
MDIAVIPARSGSKGLPGKNLLQFKGVSLLRHAIHTAEKAGVFSSIIVSTDSHEYAEEAAGTVAEVPFLRDPLLARDCSKVSDAIIDLVNKCEGAQRWRTISILEPTCPLRTIQMVKDCLFATTASDDVDSALTLSKVPLKFHYRKQFVLQDTTARLADSSGVNVNRQELGNAFIRNGAAYCVRVNSLLRYKHVPCGKIVGIVIDEELVNIDDLQDYQTLLSYEMMSKHGDI